VQADDLDQIIAAYPNSSDVNWRNGLGDASCATFDENPPSWWEPTNGSSAKMLRWCHPVGSAKRHHGVTPFDPSTSFAYV